MSCPYFYPVSPLGGSGPRAAMLPLGDFWAGHCRAAGNETAPPDPTCLRSLCNFGYARGNCPRFPDSAGPDAARFTIVADDESGVRIYYVLERDHLPFSHGPLDYSRSAREFRTAPPDEMLQRQAQAYVECYFRRKLEAGAP